MSKLKKKRYRRAAALQPAPLILKRAAGASAQARKRAKKKR